MSAQASLFDERQTEPKRVRETSREALRDISPTLGRRQTVVLVALHNYIQLRGVEPTSSELMRYMEVTDPNSCRPRLTELSELRYVEASETPTVCPVTGKKAHTWRVTDRGRLYLRGQK